MDKPLMLYRLGWEAVPRNPEIYSVRHPPVPALLKYWHTGYGQHPSGVWYDTYVGLVAAPYGIDPMTVVAQEFHDPVTRNMTTLYDTGNPGSDRFPTSEGDWDMQRMAYFAATGQLYDRPVVGHYEIAPGWTWWCTTNIELFDV